MFFTKITSNLNLDTISIRIIISMTLLVLLVTAIVAVFLNYQIENSFEEYVARQELEQSKFGQGAQDELEQQFQSTISQSLLTVRKQYDNDFRADILKSLLYAQILGVGVGLFISMLLGEQLTKPLLRLQMGIKDLTKGESSVLKEFGPTETRVLVKSFNNLVSELNRIEQLRDDMVSDIAHELKTPLTKLKGQLEGIEDGIYEANNKRIKALQADLSQLEYFITSLEDYAVIRSRAYSLDKQEINLYEFVRRLIKGHSKKKIKLVTSIEKDVVVLADPVRFKEILDNLLTNAFKYSDKGTISIQYSNGVLSISDEGIGIDSKDLPYIFERLYRVEKSRSKKTGGLGLGLAIVKELVEAHGWGVTVESMPKKGTTFSINI